MNLKESGENGRGEEDIVRDGREMQGMGCVSKELVSVILVGLLYVIMRCDQTGSRVANISMHHQPFISGERGIGVERGSGQTF